MAEAAWLGCSHHVRHVTAGSASDHWFHTQLPYANVADDDVVALDGQQHSFGGVTRGG